MVKFPATCAHTSGLKETFSLMCATPTLDDFTPLPSPASSNASYALGRGRSGTASHTLRHFPSRKLAPSAPSPLALLPHRPKYPIHIKPFVSHHHCGLTPILIQVAMTTSMLEHQNAPLASSNVGACVGDFTCVLFLRIHKHLLTRDKGRNIGKHKSTNNMENNTITTKQNCFHPIPLTTQPLALLIQSHPLS